MESIFYDKELKQTPPEHVTPAAIIYPETQFYYLKNKNEFFLAAKGGHNAESHNHNDVGTFSLWIKQTPVFIDAGVGTYTRQTFGSERYTIWTMRSLYHNLPQINGFEQRYGREYHAEDVQYDAKKRTLGFDIAQAYPPEAGIRHWYRRYKLEDNRLLITDQFDLKEANKPNDVHFLLWGNINIDEKGKIRIRIQDVEAELLYDAARFTPALETIPLPDVRLSKVWGEKIYRLTLRDPKPALKGNYSFTIKTQ
jgi:hypothetical protein